jgi:hypothetical protein
MILFFIYLLIIPVVYMILDYPSVEKLFKADPLLFILQIVGISFAIAILLSAWTRRDPELRKW